MIGNVKLQPTVIQPSTAYSSSRQALTTVLIKGGAPVVGATLNRLYCFLVTVFSWLHEPERELYKRELVKRVPYVSPVYLLFSADSATSDPRERDIQNGNVFLL